MWKYVLRTGALAALTGDVVAVVGTDTLHLYTIVVRG